MFVEQTCGTLACDGCAKVFGDQDEGSAWHFDDIAAALKTAGDCDWLVMADRVECPECVTKRECDAEGHDWSPWMGCACGGSIEAHKGGMTSRRRYCGRDHCHVSEREEVVGDCEQRYEPVKLSDGARLIEHRRNWQLIVAASPEIPVSLPVAEPEPGPALSLVTPEPVFAARVPPSGPERLRPATRHAIFFDVENTSNPAHIERVVGRLAIDHVGRSTEFFAVGNWRVIGHETGRVLARFGAQLLHSAPSTGVRDWSDLRIAVSAGVWLATLLIIAVLVWSVR